MGARSKEREQAQRKNRRLAIGVLAVAVLPRLVNLVCSRLGRRALERNRVRPVIDGVAVQRR